jgi:hypothetical protein
MANGNALLALAAGLGGGYMAAQANDDNKKRQDKKDKQEQDLHDARMEDINRGRQERIALADAVAPRTAQEGTVVDGGQTREFYADPAKVTPELQQDRQIEAEMRAEQAGTKPVSLADAKPGFGVSAGSKAQISTDRPDLASLNSREAKLQRVVDATMATDPAKALTLESAAQRNKREEITFTQQQRDYARKLDQEGVFEAVRKFRTGDAKGVVEAFNKGGDYKVVGQPEVTREDRELPGIGTIPTYTAKVKLQGPDGNVVEKTYNSHDVSMQLMPYEKNLELLRKGTDTENRGLLLDAKAAALEAKGAAQAANGGNLNREERIRYTSLFTDAGRRLGEAQKALNLLQRDFMFTKKAQDPTSPQAQQLRELQDSIKGYQEERTMYQGLLSGSQTGGGKKPPKADAAPTPEEPQAMPTSKTALKKGAVYNTARGPARWNGTAFEAQ